MLILSLHEIPQGMYSTNISVEKPKRDRWAMLFWEDAEGLESW
jgi:hypothetical protein